MKKVLIVQPFGIGDSLFVTPLIRALKKSGATVDMMLGSRTKEVFETNPHVRKFWVVDRDKLRRQSRLSSFKEIARIIFAVRREKYDAIVDCSLSREYGFLSAVFAWIPVRAGFDYKGRGFFLNRKIKLASGFSAKHVIQYYSDLGRLLGIEVEDEKPEFHVTGKAKDDGDRYLKAAGFTPSSRIIAIVPGGGESWGKDAHFKRWKPAFFSQLLTKIARDIAADGAVILGSAAEKPLGEEIAESSIVRAVNACGALTLHEAAAVLSRATLLLANDSGMVHLARSFDIPTIALYGPVSEKIYGPYPSGSRFAAVGRTDLDCRPCYMNFRYHAACEHRACLTELSPLDVTHSEAARQVLKSLNKSAEPV